MKWVNDTGSAVQMPTLGLYVEPDEEIELDEDDERTHGFLRSIGAMPAEDIAPAEPAEEPEPGSVTANLRARVEEKPTSGGRRPRGAGQNAGNAPAGKDGE